MHRTIANRADFEDFISILEFYPYEVVIKTVREEDDPDWNKLNAFFHVGIVPKYSSLTGLTEKEAKEQLQIYFATIVDHKNYYEVESISGMSRERLYRFILSCNVHMIQQFGTSIDFRDHISPKGKKIYKHK
jgi:hypothetical protein